MAFPTPLLDARLAKQKVQNEQARQQLLPYVLEWLEENAATYEIYNGYIFGSLTQPNRFTQHSDVDIAIETYKSGDVCGLMSALSMHIDRDVDAIPLDQVHFAEKIRNTGVPWTANKLPD